jgi:5'-nucleotidase
VVIAAPAIEASGSSASIMATGSAAAGAAGGQGRIQLEPRKLALDVPAFAVHAAPALIALLAAHGAFGAKPDLVLSGINRGANVGRAILHSGTVGAALTGGVNGARALAVSLAVGQVPGEAHWSTAAAVVARILPLLMESPPGSVFNLNVPNQPTAEGIEIVEARLASFGIVHATMAQRDGEHINLVIAEPPQDEGGDTDASCLAGGAATLTSIRAVHEAEQRVLPLPTGREVG